MKAKLLLAILLVVAITFSAPVMAQEKATKKCPGASSTTAGTGMHREGHCKADHSYGFKFSGFFKADLIYDQTRVSVGDYAIYVPAGPENDVMNITARETRLGLNFFWKDQECGIRTDAKLEFDFYGLGASKSNDFSKENKPAPMLRHAYIKVTKGNWSLLAGQTSDVISPLVPKTVNYTVAWGQGNIGYRRPQFRISGIMPVTDAFKIKTAVAASRTLGGDLDGDEIDDGADSAIPTFQGRLAFCSKFGDSGKVELGISGHYGKEEYTKEEVDTSEVAIESWSFNVDFFLKPNDIITLSGEYFTGQVLGSYLGGVLQSVNPLNQEIGSKGGWGMVSIKPCKKLMINAGYAWDDPDEDDFAIPESPGAGHSFKDLNSCIFGNIMYSLTSNVTAMLEVSSLKTTYMSKVYDTVKSEIVSSSEDYDDIRIQFALKAAIK